MNREVLSIKGFYQGSWKEIRFACGHKVRRMSEGEGIKGINVGDVIECGRCAELVSHGKKPQDPFVHLGITVRPTYTSSKGSGRECVSQQGWEIEWPAREAGMSAWHSSKKSAIKAIDRLHDALDKKAEDWLQAGSRGRLDMERAVRAAKQWPLRRQEVYSEAGLYKEILSQRHKEEMRENEREHNRDVWAWMRAYKLAAREHRFEMVKSLSRDFLTRSVHDVLDRPLSDFRVQSEKEEVSEQA